MLIKPDQKKKLSKPLLTTAKDASPDNVVAYSAGTIIIIALIVTLGVSWHFLRASEEKKQAAVAYFNFGPINIQKQDVGIRTTIAIQTRAGNSEWIVQNRSKLDAVFQKVLAETDPRSVLTANGVQNLQTSLKDAGNEAFDTNNVEAVYLTDLVRVQDGR